MSIIFFRQLPIFYIDQIAFRHPPLVNSVWFSKTIDIMNLSPRYMIDICAFWLPLSYLVTRQMFPDHHAHDNAVDRISGKIIPIKLAAWIFQSRSAHSAHMGHFLNPDSSAMSVFLAKIPSQGYVPLKFWNGSVISSHTLPSTWLHIHVGKRSPCTGLFRVWLQFIWAHGWRWMTKIMIGNTFHNHSPLSVLMCNSGHWHAYCD